MAFTLDFMDNFEYPDAAALQRAWHTINTFTIATVNARTGSRCLKAGSATYAACALPTVRYSVVCGFSFYVDASLAAEWPIAYVSAASPNYAAAFCQLVVSVTPSGTIKIYRGSVSGTTISGTLLGETAALLNPSMTQNHIQLKAFIHDTLGYVKVAINGVDALELVNQDTRNQASYAYFNYFGFVGPSSVVHFDDLILGSDDSTSLTSQNLFGDVSIVESLPNGTGTYNQLASSSAGTPYTDVDESLLNTADYNYSATPGQKSTYQLQDIAGSPTIKGVSLVWTAGKSTPGYREARGLTKSGATETPYTYYPLSPSGVTKQQGMLVDPNTGVAWTVAGVNALEVGVEVL